MSKSVCDSQDKFNNVFEGAVKYVEKKERPSRFLRLVSLIFMIMFVVWALLLADKIDGVNDKIVHFILALIFAPFYIISYYLNGGK